MTDPASQLRTGTHVGLEQRVLARLRDARFRDRAHFVIGFSGGADSLALAGLLRRLSSLANVKLSLRHIDHALRARSTTDAEQAMELARTLGLDCVVERLPPDLQARHPGVGLEEAARRERYAALGRHLVALDADAVVLAHHQNDQAETVLLHLLRGGGLSGSRGMSELRRVEYPWWDEESLDESQRFLVWRPLLSEPRELLRSYVADIGLTPVVDETNESRAFTRNALRLDALPVLESAVPGSVAALARYARIAADEDLLLDHLATAAQSAAETGDGGLDVARLCEDPVAIQRRVARHWIALTTGVDDVSLDRVEAVLALARATRDCQQVEVGRGNVVVVVGEVLRAGSIESILDAARRAFPGPLIAQSTDEIVFETAPGSTELRIGNWRLRRLPSEAGSAVAPGEIHNGVQLPASALEGRIMVRAPRPGDRWWRSRRTLADWVREQRVSPWLRSELCCLVGDDGVRWVAGLPLPPSEEPRLGEPTVRLELRWEDGSA